MHRAIRFPAVSDDARRRILERRAAFVAAALASVGVAACDRSAPRPCLEPLPANETRDAHPADAAAAPAPQTSNGAPDAPGPQPLPCLNVWIPPPDAAPMPCLSEPATPPHPPGAAPCLAPPLPKPK